MIRIRPIFVLVLAALLVVFWGLIGLPDSTATTHRGSTSLLIALALLVVVSGIVYEGYRDLWRRLLPWAWPQPSAIELAPGDGGVLHIPVYATGHRRGDVHLYVVVDADGPAGKRIRRWN